MANNLYIAATGPENGKITMVLGVMETLSRSIRNIGFFRPVIKAVEPPDNGIQLVLTSYSPSLSYADTYGCTYAEAHEKIARGAEQGTSERHPRQVQAAGKSMRLCALRG